MHAGPVEWEHDRPPVTPHPVVPRGWSDASQGRSGQDEVADLLGQPRPDPAHCRYCGLDPRTCDCQQQ